MQSSPGNPAYDLPSVIYPPDNVCYSVKIPNDPGYIKAFLGAVFDTTLWISWQRDAAHNGILAAQVMKAIWNDLEQQSCNSNPPEQISIGVDIGDVMIRQNPANPCQLQSSVDGTNWCTFADFSLCTPSSNQPGPGSPQPGPNGGQECYQIQMPGSQFAFLPTNVSTGDILQIQSPKGAVSSSHNALWRCEDGGQFFAGQNVGYPQMFGTDPLPGSPSGSLMAVVDGVNYFIGAGSWTVPAGISNQPLLFAVNDVDTVGLSGSYQFQVCVTNNQAGTYTHTFDFTLSAGAWTANSPIYPAGGIPYCTWNSGQGFVGNCESVGGGDYLVAANAQLATPAGPNISSITMTFDKESTGGPTGDVSVRLYYGGSSTYDEAHLTPVPNGPGQTIVMNNSASRTPTYLVITVSSQENTDPSCAGGIAVISSIVVTGAGVDPF